MTDGADDHLVDFTPADGPPETPCPIFKTTGQHSVELRLMSTPTSRIDPRVQRTSFP